MSKPPAHSAPKKRRLPVVLWAPNLIGYVRVITFVLGMYYSPASQAAVWNMVASLALDFIDGPVARKLNQCSQFGDLLDHFTDHFTMMYLVYITNGSSMFGRCNILVSALHNGAACAYMTCKGHYMKHGKGNFVTKAIEANNYWNMPSLLWGFNTYIIPLIKLSYAVELGIGVTVTTPLLTFVDALGMIVTLAYTIAMWL